MEVGRTALKILTGTPAGRRPSGRPRRRWENHIRMDLKEIAINTRNLVSISHEVNMLYKHVNYIRFYVYR